MSCSFTHIVYRCLKLPSSSSLWKLATSPWSCTSPLSPAGPPLSSPHPVQPIRAMLDLLSPTDPILLLAISDASFSLPSDVKAWFGITRATRIPMAAPLPMRISVHFVPLLADIFKPLSALTNSARRQLGTLAPPRSRVSPVRRRRFRRKPTGG